MDAQRGQPGYHRPHALCDDDALSSYRVPKYLLRRQMNSSSSESKRRMTAQISNNSSAEALADLADAEASASAGSQLALTDGEIPASHAPKKSLADIAEENKNKAEEKAQKAEALKAKQQEPSFRANRWRVRVAKSLTNLYEGLEAMKQPTVPRTLSKEHKRFIEDSKSVLQVDREKLKIPKVPPEDLIAEAEGHLEDITQHLEVWNTLHDKYKPHTN